MSFKGYFVDTITVMPDWLICDCILVTKSYSFLDPKSVPAQNLPKQLNFRPRNERQLPISSPINNIIYNQTNPEAPQPNKKKPVHLNKKRYKFTTTSIET